MVNKNILWSVDDNETKNLMVSFYKKMQKSKNYTQALQEAKLEMIAKDMHPFYWSVFILSGL